jgi:hypothetical protein
LAIADTLAPSANATRIALAGVQYSRTAKRRTLCLGALQAGLRPLNQQVALELRHSVDYAHSHAAGAACKVNTTQRWAVNANAHAGQPVNRGGNVDGIAAKAIKRLPHRGVVAIQCFADVTDQDDGAIVCAGNLAHRRIRGLTTAALFSSPFMKSPLDQTPVTEAGTRGRPPR